MDGTLYFQRPVQLLMAARLALYVLFHPRRLNEALALLLYRQLYSRGLPESERFAELVRKYGFEASEARRVVDTWMLKKPRGLVRRFRDKRLIAFLESKRAEGFPVIVYSDYPLEDKMAALEPFAIDGLFVSEKIGALKPDPSGVLEVLRRYSLAPEDCLFLGDSYAKDGRCAEAAGIDYIVLDKSRFARNKFYGKALLK
jgi:FMN phosphatase YigB (HAD superfamily)